MFFTDPTDLARALDTTDTLTVLAAAVDASTPALTMQTRTLPTHAAFVIQDANAPLHTRTTIQLLITPTTGAFTINGTAINARRWHAALDTLAADTASAWDWKPANLPAPGHFKATMRNSPHYKATTGIERTNHDTQTSNTELTLTPRSRATCVLTWQAAVKLCHLLLTGRPAPASASETEPKPRLAHAPQSVLDAFSAQDVHDLLRYGLCLYQSVAPCSPPTAERTADIMRRGRAFLIATRDTVIRLDADAAVNHATDQTADPAPSDRALLPAWETWRDAVREHLRNGCRAVGIDQPDAVRSAMRMTDYQRRTPGPLSDEVDALTQAGAQWHHTPSGVFWTDPDHQD
ncbi:hypothetical protein ACFVYG_22420 [Streptomyces sp. NPDC058256]|uniref:hypothetical protein n=1 Tax=Streptomyces sp. NPDC058256 TaxID=3346408 RepID=UPI0036EFA9CF